MIAFGLYRGNAFMRPDLCLMEQLDNQVSDFLRELGIAVMRTQGATEHYNVTTYHGASGPFINVVRPKAESNFYVIAMNVALHRSHQDKMRTMSSQERERSLNQIKYMLLSMNVDFAFLPQGSDVPTNVQLEKILYAGPDCFLQNFFESYTLVRNAGLLVITKLMEEFGPVEPEAQPGYM